MPARSDGRSLVFTGLDLVLLGLVIVSLQER